MPTTKNRINLTVPDETNEVLIALAKRDNTSVSAKVMECIELALDLEEDIVLGKLAEERLAKNTKWISHDDAWV